jgi:hypothetical protein
MLHSSDDADTMCEKKFYLSGKIQAEALEPLENFF